MSAPPVPVRGVIFDVGNVLVRLHPIGAASFPAPGRAGGQRDGASSGGGRRDGTAIHAGPPPDPLGALRADPVMDRFERGRATEEEFCDAVRRALGQPIDDAAILSVYLGILGDPMPGMAELIAGLKGRGIRVVGLTDTSPVHLARLDRYPAVRALERLVASCSTSFRKPEPEAYRAALAAIGTQARETLFIDDQPGNVAGAIAVGLQGLVFRGAGSVRDYLGEK